MATESRKIGLYAAVGFSMAALIIAGVFISGIQLPTIGAKTGKLLILLTDAPVPDIEKLNVTIANLSIVGEEGEIQLPFDGETELYIDNLLALEGEPEPLFNSNIPVGNYTQIRMNITYAYAYFGVDDERNTELRVPSDIIKVQAKFEIKQDGSTIIVIDMEPDWVAISASNNLRPVLKVISITTSTPS
jgi:hypothetical protein